MNKIIEEDLDFILGSDIDWGKFKDSCVLVTGAYGMLLSYVTCVLLRLNEVHPEINVKVIALVRDREKARKRFEHFIDDKHLILFEHDLVMPIDLTENVDYIFHGASYASPRHFLSNPSAVIVPNIIGTYNLLKFYQTKNIKSFLLFSSGAVYGTPLDSEIVTEEYCGYLNPLDVGNCYGESKRMAENMCRCWYHQFDLPVKIVRPAHIYGPTMDIESDSRVFASFVGDVVKGRNIVMKSAGMAKRSFCYIADATVAYFKIILDGVNGEAYNVGNDSAYISIRELARVMADSFPEKNLRVVVENTDDGCVAATKNDQMLMLSKKTEDLGWRCRFSLEEGLQRTVQSFNGV